MKDRPARWLCLSIIAVTVACICLSGAAAPRLLLADDGLNGADQVPPESARQPAVKVSGWLREIGSDHLVIGEHVLQTSQRSFAKAGLEEGAYVVATAEMDKEGTLRAESVQVLPTGNVEGVSLSSLSPLAAPISVGESSGYAFEFRGVLGEVTPRYWVVGNRLVLISDRTQVQGRPEIGALADVKGLALYSGVVLAKTIKLTYPDAFVEVEFEGIIEQWSADSWVVSGVDVRLNAVTAIVGTPAQGMVAEVQGILQPDDSVLAQRISVKAPGFAARVDIQGTVEEISSTYWIIAGQTVSVDSGTFVDESQAPAEIGQWAQVSALLRRDGTLLALRVRLSRYR